MPDLSKPCLKIAAFPPGDDVWQIDWLGQIGFPDRLGRSNQPSVCVSLSRVGLIGAIDPFAQQSLKCWVITELWIRSGKVRHIALMQHLL